MVKRVSEELLPKSIKISQGLLHHVTQMGILIEQEFVESCTHRYHNVCCPAVVPPSLYFLWRQILHLVLFFKSVELTYPFQKAECPFITALLISVFEFRSGMSHTAQVIHIIKLIVYIHIYIVTITLKSGNLSILEEVTEHITTTASVIIEIDDNMG